MVPYHSVAEYVFDEETFEYKKTSVKSRVFGNMTAAQRYSAAHNFQRLANNSPKMEIFRGRSCPETFCIGDEEHVPPQIPNGMLDVC